MADAVLPVGDGTWRVFRLGSLRHARLDGTPAAWSDSAGALAGDPASRASRVAWMAIPSPDGAFRPVHVVQGARGYFLLVDAASSRLCLYDTAAALLSTFPLPERFTPFPSGRAAVFRGADGTFLFADYTAGEAWQYADREVSQGAAAWVLRARVKMPMGWRDCYQQPGTDELSCRSAAGALRFDGALNRIGGPRKAPASSMLSWDPGERGWVLTGLSLQDSAPLFRFRPARRVVEAP